MAKASDLNKVKGTGTQKGVRRGLSKTGYFPNKPFHRKPNTNGLKPGAGGSGRAPRRGLPKPFPNRILHPKGGPLRTMSGSKPYGFWEDAGNWIGTAGHNINKLVGGGDHEAGAKKIKGVVDAVGKYALDTLEKGRKHYFGFGGKPKKYLPKGKNFPKRTTNKVKTGLVNKHKYKKGTMMV